MGNPISHQEAQEEATRLAEKVMGEISQETLAARRERRLLKQQAEGKAPRRLLYLIALSIIFAGLSALNFTGHGPFSMKGPAQTPLQVKQLVRREVSDLVHDLEIYHEQVGRYPADLGEFVLDKNAWEYEISAKTQYRLAIEARGYQVEYNSSDDADEIFSDIRGMR